MEKGLDKWREGMTRGEATELIGQIKGEQEWPVGPEKGSGLPEGRRRRGSAHGRSAF